MGFLSLFLFGMSFCVFVFGGDVWDRLVNGVGSCDMLGLFLVLCSGGLVGTFCVYF